MIFDTRRHLNRTFLSDSSEWVEVSPDTFVWAGGYCFEGDEPRIGEELRESVGRVLGEKDPGKGLAQLNGSYCAAYASLGSPAIVKIASDRLGTRPLYHALLEDGVVLGDDFWAIADSLPDLKLSAPAALEMLSFDYVMGEHTLVEKIEELPAAGYARFDKTPAAESWARHGPQVYWRRDINPQSRSREEMVSALAEILEQVGDRYARLIRKEGVETIGLNLTSGQDCRFIARLLHSHGIKFHCFTSRSIGEDNEGSFEVARVLDVPHSYVPFWGSFVDEPPEKILWEIAPTTMFSIVNHHIALLASGPWQVDAFMAGHCGDPLRGQCSLSTYMAARKGMAAIFEDVTKKHLLWGPSELAKILRQEWKSCADQPMHALERLCQQTQTSHNLAVAFQINIEQRQRRFVYRDIKGLLEFGPTFLPLADYHLWDFFTTTVPAEWQLDGCLHTCTLVEKLFTRSYSELGKIPINGKLYRPMFHPIARAYVSAAKRRLTTIGRKAVNPFQQLWGKTDKLCVQDFYVKEFDTFRERADSLDWLCDMDSLRKHIDMNRDNLQFLYHGFRSLYTLARVSGRVLNP